MTKTYWLYLLDLAFFEDEKKLPKLPVVLVDSQPLRLGMHNIPLDKEYPILEIDRLQEAFAHNVDV